MEEEAAPSGVALNIRSVARGGKPPASAALPEEIDALSEAELFLNFGRDAQAEEVLKDALTSNPDNIPVQLKLLSIYANRKDANAFSSIARKVKDSGDAEAWQQAAVLGYSIDPNNPMYEEGKSAAAAAADMLSESGKPPAGVPLDMDVGFDIPMDLDVTAAMPDTSEDKGAGKGAASDFDVSVYDTATPMDFDVTGSHPNVGGDALLPDFDVTGGHAPAAPTGTDFDITGGQSMDFDVTGAFPGTEAVAPGFGAGESAATSEVMDFDIGAAPQVEPESSGLGGLSFDVSAESGEFGGAGAEAEFQAVSSAPETGDSSEAGGLAFDIGSFSSPSESVESTQVNVPQTAGTGGMDFDISALTDAESSAAETAAPEESSDVGGLAFDIGAFTSSDSVEATQVNVPQTAGDGGMDFDISAPLETEATAAASTEESPDIGGLAFDVGAMPEEETPAADLGGPEQSSAVEGLAFDLSGSLPSVESTQVNVPRTSGDGGMDFDISGATGEPSAFDVSSGGLDFDISASQPEPAAVEEGDLASTVVLDSATDFDISAPLDSTAALEPHTEFADFGAEGGSDFDLGAASSVVVPSAGGEMAGLAGGMDLELGATETLSNAAIGSEGASSLGTMDFDISAAPEADSGAPGLAGISLDLGGAEGASEGDDHDEAGADVENKLELARAFQEMGDADTARELLGEVVKEGNPRQIESAQQLIQQL